MHVDEVSVGTLRPSTSLGDTKEALADLSAESDGDLGALALGGRRDAWDALFRRHHRRILVALLARGIPADRARDMTQETWARLVEHQRAGRLDRLELPGLAIRQATFLALDEVRRTAKLRSIDGSPESDLREEVAFLRDSSPSIEDRLIARGQLERASAELDRCAPRARHVFEEVYENPDTPHAVVAHRLGMSVERLRHALCEVRARLRAALEDDPVSLAFTRGKTPETSDD